MSGASVSKLLNNAFQQVGNILGFNFKLYRSVDYLSPVQDKNYVSTIKAAYTIDENFRKTITANFSVYKIYTNATKLIIGDILVSDDLGKTFVLINNDPIIEPQAIWATGKISINRAEYTTTNGFGPKQVEIATDVPATVTEISSSSTSMDKSPMKGGIQNWEIWLWLPHNNIKLNDNITDNNGNNSTVISVEHTPMGYKVKTMATRVGAK